MMSFIKVIFVKKKDKKKTVQPTTRPSHRFLPILTSSRRANCMVDPILCSKWYTHRFPVQLDGLSRILRLCLKWLFIFLYEYLYFSKQKWREQKPPPESVKTKMLLCPILTHHSKTFLPLKHLPPNHFTPFYLMKLSLSLNLLNPNKKITSTPKLPRRSQRIVYGIGSSNKHSSSIIYLFDSDEESE